MHKFRDVKKSDFTVSVIPVLHHQFLQIPESHRLFLWDTGISLRCSRYDKEITFSQSFL